MVSNESPGVDRALWPHQVLVGLVDENGDARKTCRTCGMVGGPWPNGDRPQTSPLTSGCHRCGWCY